MSPLYHLYGAIGAIIFNSPRAGMFLSVGTVLALSILLVYATARLLLPARWAVLQQFCLHFRPKCCNGAFTSFQQAWA